MRRAADNGPARSKGELSVRELAGFRAALAGLREARERAAGAG